MTERNVCVGDRYRIGCDCDTSVVLEVSQPRQPCWKLAHNSGQRSIPALMQERAATGWYYRVITPGPVRAGATIELISRPCPDWSLQRIVKGFYGTPLDRSFLEQIAALPLLGRAWRDTAAARLETGIVEDWTRRLYGR